MDLQEKTQQLTDFFNKLRTFFGAGKMAGWSLIVSPTPPYPSTSLHLEVAHCNNTHKTIWMCSTTVDLLSIESNKENLIHEFAHLYTYEVMNKRFWGHSLGFNVIVALLNAKYQLSFESSLYNISVDYYKRFSYDPALLYRYCRFVAPKIKNAYTLDHYFKLYMDRTYFVKGNRINLLKRNRHYQRIEESVYDLKTQNLGLRRITGLAILAGVMPYVPFIIEWSVKNIGS